MTADQRVRRFTGKMVNLVCCGHFARRCTHCFSRRCPDAPRRNVLDDVGMFMRSREAIAAKASPEVNPPANDSTVPT